MLIYHETRETKQLDVRQLQVSLEAESICAVGKGRGIGERSAAHCTHQNNDMHSRHFVAGHPHRTFSARSLDQYRDALNEPGSGKIKDQKRTERMGGEDIETMPLRLRVRGSCLMQRSEGLSCVT